MTFNRGQTPRPPY